MLGRYVADVVSDPELSGGFEPDRMGCQLSIERVAERINSRPSAGRELGENCRAADGWDSGWIVWSRTIRPMNEDPVGPLCDQGEGPGAIQSPIAAWSDGKRSSSGPTASSTSPRM